MSAHTGAGCHCRGHSLLLSTFFFFYRQDRSPNLVLTDWHTDQLATGHQEIFLSLPLK